MKKFGIYLCYPPTVDLRMEGLGRHLGEFLKGAQARGDIDFVIACPSWLTSNLRQLFESCSLTQDSIEVIAPRSPPLLLTVYRKYVAYTSRKQSAKRRPGLRKKLQQHFQRAKARIERRLAITRTVFGAMFWGFMMFSLLIAGMILRPTWVLPSLLYQYVKRACSKSMALLLPGRKSAARTAAPAEASPRQESLAWRMYRVMEENEAALIAKLIDARKDIVAWYSPTAFWPYFNDISAARLMCVPDVVLTDFPAGFAAIGGFGMERNFNQVEAAIQQGEYFVTYSEHTKWETLVRRYGMDPDAVFVVRHGANRLDDLIRVTGFPDNAVATEKLCRSLLVSALQKDLHRSYSGFPLNTDIRFIFYASQFRPNKNIISLLRAYDHLLKRCFIGHKLVLTGNPRELDDVVGFIADRNLQSDVLCLHGLSEQELAACYHLADLAVNPSLSEGGCPFTFTEAMSVGTPAVMARIAVTEEVITDPELQDMMLFDPYDWTDMADRIEWSLRNPDLLRAKQQPFYERLAQRNWGQVVDEYVDILERISSERRSNTCIRAAAC
jgi:hypothetical protein